MRSLNQSDSFMPQALSEKLPASELEALSPMLNREGKLWTADFQGLKLKTALQPIYSIFHKRIVGYEALIRAFDTDNSAVLPLHLFQLPLSDAEDLLLDRLCRYLHIRNYCGISDQLNWLFLNVSPRVVTSGDRADSFFGQLLEKTGLPPHRIVMEIVEQPTDDAKRLKDTVAYYKKLGCLTAIDDFGAGHSNFERIWNLSPDIVKLDRTLLTRATDDQKARQILNGIASLLHQSGCLVLLEGVESRDQAMIAIDAGVDFVQGFYFRRPSIELDSLGQNQTDFNGLLHEYKIRNQIVADPTHQLTQHFNSLFLHATERLCEGAQIHEACATLLEHPVVSRCYLVGNMGQQIGNTIISEAGLKHFDLRFRPLESARNADWFQQEYLRQALSSPGKLQVTAPYLCVTGAYMCVTLSLAFHHNGKLKVLCCDILANTAQQILNRD